MHLSINVEKFSKGMKMLGEDTELQFLAHIEIQEQKEPSNDAMMYCIHLSIGYETS